MMLSSFFFFMAAVISECVAGVRVKKKWHPVTPDRLHKRDVRSGLNDLGKIRDVARVIVVSADGGVQRAKRHLDKSEREANAVRQ